MRRSIVPYSLVVFASILLLAVPATAAGASSSPHILCPAIRSGNGVIPCCPVPVNSPTACCPQTLRSSSIRIACCAPTTCCAANMCPPPPSGGLTISSSPDPSVAGQAVRVTGALSGSSVGGVQVVLWHELAGRSSFSQFGQATTSGTGQYAITLGSGTVTANQQFYVTAAGQRSPTIVQRVDAVVALSPSARAVRAGHSLALRGHVSPSHAGERLMIQVRRRGRWVAVAHLTLGRASRFATSMRFARPGKVKLRAVLRANARNQRSDSPTVTVTVRP